MSSTPEQDAELICRFAHRDLDRMTFEERNAYRSALYREHKREVERRINAVREWPDGWADTPPNVGPDKEG